METNPTIYVLTDGEYSDYHIVGVFTSREKAEIAQNLYPDSGIEEYGADIVPEHPPGMVAWEVLIHPGNMDIAVTRTPPIKEPREYHFPGHADQLYLEAYVVACWARDAEHAQKIALDKFYQFKAQQTGVAL